MRSWSLASIIALVGLACSSEDAKHAPVLELSCSSPELHANVHDGCAPMDATDSPDESGSSCFCALGYAWDGTTCVFLGDCRCIGADCDKLTESLDECLAEHADCAAPIACGNPDLHLWSATGCAALDAAGEGDCHCELGYTWDGDSCVALTGCDCAGADCVKLSTSLADCQALHATCPQTISCGDPALFSLVHDGCAPMDATSDGACYCLVGYLWDGGECVGLTGCGCTGSDCDRLAETLEDCQAAHAACS